MANMDYFFEGRAVWADDDDVDRGLVHGEVYSIRASRLSRGRIRVDIDADNYNLLVNKITFKDEIDYKLAFKPAPKGTR